MLCLQSNKEVTILFKCHDFEVIGLISKIFIPDTVIMIRSEMMTLPPGTIFILWTKLNNRNLSDVEGIMLHKP